MADFISPNKEVKSFDVGLCLICQTKDQQTDYKKYIFTPSKNALEKIITCSCLRYGYGETQFSKLHNYLQGFSSEDLLRLGYLFLNIATRILPIKVN